MPPVPARSFSTAGATVRSLSSDPIAYGLISNVRLPAGTSTPVSVPAADRRNIPAPAEMGTPVR